jgi:hypothetical protein
VEAGEELATIFIASSFCKLYLVSLLRSSGSGALSVGLDQNDAELESYTGLNWGIVEAAARRARSPGKNKHMFDQYLAQNGLAVTEAGLMSNFQSIWATLITVPFSSAGSK